VAARGRKRVSEQDRLKIMQEKLPDLVRRLHEMRNERKVGDRTTVVLLKKGVYSCASQQLLDAGFRVPQSRPIPFPLGSWRQTMVQEVRKIMRDSSTNS
jgi:hypothetical protein